MALYLVSRISFAILLPNDLLAKSFAARIFPDADPARLRIAFNAARKIQILSTQMTWVVGNVPEYGRIEMFSQRLRTAAPITGQLSLDSNTFDSPVPTVIEDWIKEQGCDIAFRDSIASLPL